MQTFNGRFIKPIQQNQHKIDTDSLKKKIKNRQTQAYKKDGQTR